MEKSCEFHQYVENSALDEVRMAVRHLENVLTGLSSIEGKESLKASLESAIGKLEGIAGQMRKEEEE